MEQLHFKGSDPGAVTLGNFINYYSFHSPGKRMESFPKHIWVRDEAVDFVCLDIGCNSGDLTEEVFKFLSHNLKQKASEEPILEGRCVMLCIDIDPVLIERAKEKNKYGDSLYHLCADIMKTDTDEILQEFLYRYGKKQFDVIFCFSVTMWIHLNHGDSGLQMFLRKICKASEMVVIEPQPWKCYRTAVKRLKKYSESLPLFDKLNWRLTVDNEIECYMIDKCHMNKIYETPKSEWGRSTSFYKNKGQESTYFIENELLKRPIYSLTVQNESIH